MRLADISLSFQFLRTFTKIFGLAAFLFTASACAQDPTIPTASSTATDAKAALQPYLGKWRPTSYSEGLNIGSLTISVDGLSYEVGGASVSYEVVRKTDEGVILRVTGYKPVSHPRAAKAMAFSLEMHTVKAVVPTDVTTTRQLLSIYSCGSVDSLTSGFAQGTKTTCSKNTYTR